MGTEEQLFSMFGVLFFSIEVLDISSYFDFWTKKVVEQ